MAGDDELTPDSCKWCGNPDPDVRKTLDRWYVGCQGCGMSGPTQPTRRNAIAAWNSITITIDSELRQILDNGHE